MESKYYVPWDLAAKLGLLGFNELCPRVWSLAKNKRSLLNQTQYGSYNFNPRWFPSEDIPDRNNPRIELRKRCARGTDESQFYTIEQLIFIWKGRHVAAATYDQAREFFRVNYDIDFIERPQIGRVKQYLCDISGPNIGFVKFEPSDTPFQAQLNALTYLADRLEPLPEKEFKTSKPRKIED